MITESPENEEDKVRAVSKHKDNFAFGYPLTHDEYKDATVEGNIADQLDKIGMYNNSIIVEEAVMFLKQSEKKFNYCD